MDGTDLANIILPSALFLVMFGVGLTLRPQDFLRALTAPKAILLGMFGQLILLPILGICVVFAFQLPPVYAVGLMILCFAPGGATSNMLTLLARGDTALSISLTAISGLITPFTLPVLTYFTLEYWMGSQTALAFPVLQSIGQIVLISLLPALLGLLFSQHYPLLALRLHRSVKIVSILFMIVVVIGLVRSNSDTLAEQLGLLAPAVLTLCGLGLLAGWVLARLARFEPERQVTLGLEVGVQNAGTAILVSGALLGSADMALTALSYGVLMNGPAIVVLLVRNRELLSRRRLSTSGW